MSDRFKFERKKPNGGITVPVTETEFTEVRRIAEANETTMREVARKFFEIGLEEYKKEHGIPTLEHEWKAIDRAINPHLKGPKK